MYNEDRSPDTEKTPDRKDTHLPHEDAPHARILFGSDRTDHYRAMQLDSPGLKKVELKKEDGRHPGFAISQQEGTHTALFPHVYDMKENSTVTFCLKGAAGANIQVLADEKEAGTIALDAPCESFTEITLDWFRFSNM